MKYKTIDVEFRVISQTDFKADTKQLKKDWLGFINKMIWCTVAGVNLGFLYSWLVE